MKQVESDAITNGSQRPANQKITKLINKRREEVCISDLPFQHWNIFIFVALLAAEFLASRAWGNGRSPAYKLFSLDCFKLLIHV